MATQDEIDTIRERCGEIIPEGGTESDTLFTDAQVTRWIDSTPLNLDAAVREGWLVKQAHFANLVNTTDGAAARTFSDLFNHATSMVAQYTLYMVGPSAGRARVGRIRRHWWIR